LISTFMIRGLLSVLIPFSALALTLAAEAPGEFYVNRISVVNQQVNARHFVNEGEFLSGASQPWDSQNTVTFTNRALMLASPGFRFEHVDPTFGFRSPAEVFYNSPNGEVLGQDSGFNIIIGNPDDTGGAIFLPSIIGSILKVNALNLTNRGVLKVGANGLIELFGQRVDLTAGALIVGDLNDPLSGGGGGSGFPLFNTNQFNPAPGVYDLGWGISFSTNASAAGVIGGVNPTVVSTLIPSPLVTNAFGFGGCEGIIMLDDAQIWLREEVIDETNEVVQVIAVQTSDTNVLTFASFIPRTFPNAPPLGGFLTPAIEFRVGSTDFATLARVTNSLYVLDQLGTHTNRDLMLNLQDATFRPGNFIVHRGPPELYDGEVGTTNIREDIFTFHLDPDVDYLNAITTNEWSIYSAQIVSAPTRLPQIPGIAITNLGGRVEVTANELKLANTRIRGEGFVSLTASNITSGPNVVVDVPRLTLDFGTRSNVFNLGDLTPDRVERFSGYIQAYSSIFTNGYERLATNVDPTTMSNVITTNIVEVRFQLTIVDGRTLQTTEETVVQDLRLTAANGAGAIIFNESLSVTNYVDLRASHVTFAEGSRLYGARGVALSYTNLHNISHFTNFGTIQVNEFADLRRSLNAPYEQFVNHGDILAYGAEIHANYFENTGTIASSNFFTIEGGTDCFGVPSLFTQSGVTPGNIDIRANTMRIDAGLFFTQGDIRLTGDVLKLSSLEAFAGARLVLDVGQTITDTGVAEANDITVFGGVEMSSRRPSGDLLGTTIRSSAGTLDFIDHIWAADDRGASASGFENNLALGRLVLEGELFSVFQFLPSRPGAAMYIDVLEINGAQAENIAALTNGLILGMNVYYADVVSTNPAINAQSLDRVFGPNAPFNLIWVPGFAGPNSAVDVPLAINGPVGRMNRGLRESLTADTDGDGIPNGRDPYPMTASAAGESNDVLLLSPRRDAAGGTLSFDLVGPRSARYVVEYTTNLIAPNWQVVPGSLTTDTTTGLNKFTDQLNKGSAQGYYRVRIAP
jgi:hypothetical protein